MCTVTPRTGRRLLVEGLALWILGTLCLIPLRILQLSVMGFFEGEYDPWTDLLGMYLIAPIGWGLFGLVGPLWIVLLGLILAGYTRKRAWHLVTFCGVLIFGYHWPKVFWMWMSV